MKPEKLTPIQVTLLAHGMAECTECRSWVFATKAAEFFHMRRCRG